MVTPTIAQKVESKRT